MEMILCVLIYEGIPLFYTVIAYSHCPFCSLPLILFQSKIKLLKYFLNVPQLCFIASKRLSSNRLFKA